MSKISSPKHQLSEAQKQPKREMLKFVNLLALPIRIFNAGMASKSASVTRKAKKTKFESGKGPTLTRSWINDVSLSFLLSSPLFILPRLTYRLNCNRSSWKTFYQDSSFLRCHWANLKITCCMSNTHPKICKWRLLVARYHTETDLTFLNSRYFYFWLMDYTEHYRQWEFFQACVETTPELQTNDEGELHHPGN